MLINPTSPEIAEAQSKDLQTTARALGLQLHFLRASTEGDFEVVFATIGQLKVGGLVISSDSFFFAKSELLAALASRHGVPAIFGFPEFAKAGGLIRGQDRRLMLAKFPLLPPVCTENLIHVDEVAESPKLAQ